MSLSALGISTLTTSAIFSDDETSTSAITTGSIDLGIDDVNFSVPVDNMLPGASIVKPVHVSNDGSLLYQYGIVAQATNADPANLSTMLRMRIYDIAAADCTLANTETGSPNRISPAGNAWGISTSETNIVGDATIDAAPGNRELVAQTAEDLCVRVDFNSAADDAFQDSSTSLDLIFKARQVDFDPTDPGESNP